MLERRIFLKSSVVLGALALTPSLTKTASALILSWENQFEGTALYWDLACWRMFMNRHCDVSDSAVLKVADEFRALQRNVERTSQAHAASQVNAWTNTLSASELAARYPLFVRWVAAEAHGLLDWSTQVNQMKTLAGASNEAFFAMRLAWATWAAATNGIGTLQDAEDAFERASQVSPDADRPHIAACLSQIRNSTL